MNKQTSGFSPASIRELMNIGATEEEAKNALTICNGNIEQAADYILNQTSKENAADAIISGVKVSPVFRRLYNMQNTCDVTFLIGKDKVPFPAHKAIMSIYSKVFDNMFFPKSEIVKTVDSPEINDSRPEEFKIFLTYCYTGVLPANELSTYINLYIFADTYLIVGLKETLNKPITDLITGANALSVYVMTKNDLLKDFHQAAETYICKNASNIFNSKGLFLKLEKDFIKEILGLELRITENMVLERIVEYVLSQGGDDRKALRKQEKDILDLVDLNSLDTEGINIAFESGLYKKKDLLKAMLKLKKSKT